MSQTSLTSWLREEFESDMEEWRSDRPVRRTVVGVLEVVFAIGIIIRAGMHIGGVMISVPKRFKEVKPEVDVGFGWSHTVVRKLPLGIDLSSRLLAAVYAAWWVQHFPSLISVSPTVDVLVRAYIFLNLGFVVLDPVWLVFDRLT